jgi:hypothetical protein
VCSTTPFFFFAFIATSHVSSCSAVPAPNNRLKFRWLFDGNQGKKLQQLILDQQIQGLLTREAWANRA